MFLMNKKLCSTIDYYAKENGLIPELYPDLHELEKDEVGFLSYDDYQNAVKFALNHREMNYTKKTINGIKMWETANHALCRFNSVINHLNKKHYNESLLIVSHSSILNLYFADKLGLLSSVYERYQSNAPCDWGCIINNSISIDIAHKYT